MNRSRKIVAIIQARTGSTRLPGKVLMLIAGKPMLWHIINRLKYCKNIDAIMVATTDKNADDPILAIAKECNVEAYAGSEEDVLDRYYQAAKKLHAEVIVRLTADCPLLDPQIVDKVIDYYLTNSIDYVNTGPTFPEGLDTEVFNFVAIEKAWLNAKQSFEREHVSIYIHEHPELFRLATVENDEDLSSIRLTVDRYEDIAVVRRIFDELYQDGRVFYIDEALSFLKKHPEIASTNKDVPRNEGFLESLKKEGMDINNPNAPYSEWVKKYSSDTTGRQEPE